MLPPFLGSTQRNNANKFLRKKHQAAPRFKRGYALGNFLSLFMKVHPLNLNILLSPLSAEDKTQSGLILPDSHLNERPEQALVSAVGPKVTTIKVGETVLFKKYAPDEVKVENEKFLIINENDILAVLEK